MSKLTKNQVHDLVKDADISTPEWAPSICWAKCVKVWDGDTIHVVAPTGEGQVSRFIIRCLGYDTPEIRSSAKKKVSEKEKTLAREARDLLRDRIMGKLVRLENVKCEKTWGRILANVMVRAGRGCRAGVREGGGGVVELEVLLHYTTPH